MPGTAPATSTCLAYSRATSTAVAAVGTTRSSTPAGPWMLITMVASAEPGMTTSDTVSPFTSARRVHRAPSWLESSRSGDPQRSTYHRRDVNG